MRADTKYLKHRGRAWWFKLKVPVAVRDCYDGKEHIEIALGTRDLDEANLRKLPLIARFKREFSSLQQVDPANRAAERFRLRLRELAGRDDSAAEGEELHIASMVDEAVERMIEVGGVPIERAQAWARLATTTEPTISELLDQWLASASYRKQTAQQHRHAVAGLKEYLGGDLLPSTVTGDIAADYVLKVLKPSASAYNTKRRKLNSLHAFWQWMSEHRLVPRGFNPWSGFRLSKGARGGASGTRRGYTDKELTVLFEERPDYPHLAEVMVLGLFTGARLDELCSLQAEDVTQVRSSYIVRITKSKTRAGIRSIVICHRVPIGLLKSLLKEHAAGPLFPELRGGGYDDRLSWAVSKAFGRFRDKRGLTRQTVFHSFRNTVITILENKGVQAGHVASFVGHKGGTLARDVYSDGPAFKTLREVARKIVYRKPVESVISAFCTRAEINTGDP